MAFLEKYNLFPLLSNKTNRFCENLPGNCFPAGFLLHLRFMIKRYAQQVRQGTASIQSSQAKSEAADESLLEFR